MDDLEQIALLVVGFLAILVAAYLVTRFLGLRVMQMGSSKYIKVVDRVVLGTDKSICLIQMGENYYLTGITNHHIELLGQVKENELIPISASTELPFGSVLDRYISKVRENKDRKGSIDSIKEKLKQQRESIKKL